MNKKELEEIESVLVDIDNSDDKIDVIERLYSIVLRMYRKQCLVKLKHKPLV